MNSFPLPVGQSSTSASYAGMLGQVYREQTSSGFKFYRLVKNGTGTTLAAGDVVINGMTSGAPNWNVNTTTTANHPDVAGVVPNDFGSATIAANAYFLLLVDGAGRPKFAQTTITETAANGGALGTATTAGYCQLLVGTASGTAAAVLNDASTYASALMGVAQNTAAVTAAGQLGYAMIQCLE